MHQRGAAWKKQWTEPVPLLSAVLVVLVATTFLANSASEPSETLQQGGLGKDSLPGGEMAAAGQSAPCFTTAAVRGMPGEHTPIKLVDLDFLLWLPRSYSDDARGDKAGKGGFESGDGFPLLVFFHGAGEVGTDVDRIRLQGPPKLVDQHPDGTLAEKFAVLSIQKPPDLVEDMESYADKVGLVVNAVLNGHAGIHPDRVSLTGVSMGGFDTFFIGQRHAQMWAALVPICGFGDVSLASRLVEFSVSVWVFHGANDVVISVNASDALVKELRRLSKNSEDMTIEYTRYDTAPGRDPNWLPQDSKDPPATKHAREIPEMEGHASWVPAYEGKDSEELWKWLLRQRRKRQAHPG